MPVLQNKNSGDLDVKVFSRRELLLIALYIGFCSAIIQVLLIRELLALCRGNELIIGIIYSSWFLGIYTGARYRPAAGIKRPERRLYTSVFMLPVSAAVSIYLPYLIQLIFPRTAGTFYSLSSEFLIAFLFTLPVSFFVGLFFPPLVSLISSEIGQRSGGTVFCIESIGSFAGGIVFSFLLVDHANPIAIISMITIAALLTVFTGRKRKLLALAFVPAVLIVFSGRIENGIIKYTWDRTRSGSLLEYKRTKFGAVAVESSGSIASVYGDGIFIYNIPDSYESRGLFHLVRSLRPDWGRVLLFGSGPGSLAHNLQMYSSGTLHYFDPDPALRGILAPYIRTFYRGQNSSKSVFPGEELKHFLKRSSARFDMIISIPPQPENIMMNRFYTKEFYSLCRSHLDEKGIFVTALYGFSDYISSERRDYIASVYSAFSSVFPVHLLTSGEVIYLIGANREGVLPASPELLISDYSVRWRSGIDSFEKEITENFSPDELLMSFEKTRLQYFDRIIKPVSERTEPNSDLKPGAYWRYIVLSAFREQSVLYSIIKSYAILPAVILLLSAIALWDIKRRRGRSSMLNGALIYTTGFISISTMLVMVLLYQNSSGIVYHHISLINALYMLGLGAGSFLFSRGRALKLPYLFIGIGITLLLIYVLTIYESLVLFWSIIPLFSFLCGAVFPVLFGYSSGSCYEDASVLDSMDNYGAIAGSLLTVLFLVPLLGIQLTIILNALLLFPAAITGFAASRGPYSLLSPGSR